MMQSFYITSIKDARVVEARELTSVAGRARFQKTQLEGEESIQWALEAHLLVEHIFYSANLRQRAILEMLQARGIACYAVSDGVLKKISDTSYLVPMIASHVCLPPQKGHFPRANGRSLNSGAWWRNRKTRCSRGSLSKRKSSCSRI